MGGGEGNLVSGKINVELLAGSKTDAATNRLGDDNLVFRADEDLDLRHMFYIL